MRVIVRAWNEAGYHKDLAILDEQQVRMHHAGMDAQMRHVTTPPTGIRVIVNPKDFPEMVEFEVIVQN